MIALFGKFFPGLAKPSSRRDELTELLQESIEDKTSFDSHEGALLRNLLGLRDKTAIDVMIPRADIVSVALTDSLDAIVKQMSAANHSRVPVYRDTLDDVAGIIHIKDLVAYLQNGKMPAVHSLLRSKRGVVTVSCSSSISPTISSTKSSIVIKPSTPPNSSTTSAKCRRRNRISFNRSSNLMVGDTNSAGRKRLWTAGILPFRKYVTRSLIWMIPATSSNVSR